MARKYQSADRTGHTILVIDDSPEILESAKQLLEREGHTVLVAPDGETGIAIAEREHPHLIVCDFFMPKMTGEEVVRQVRLKDKLVQIILATGYSGEKPARVMLRQLDIQGYHDKSEGAERLLLWVDSALKAYRSALSAEKHRIGLQYILDITPDLHRLQPVDELLKGLLWQIEGLVGAENSFLATFSSETISRAAMADPVEGFVALRDEGSGANGLEIRVGTGRFRAGLSTVALPEPERSLVHEAVTGGGVSFSEGVSVLPLRFGEQVLGTIFIDRRPGFDRDRDLLEIFASQAAAAIQSALLYGQNAMLYDLATKDPTTGAYLRGYAMQQFQQHLKRCHRNSLPLSVLMIDLDKFKPINDRHGHVLGDAALRAVGHFLQRSVRETDCVGRFGGDEFMIILPDTPAEGAHILAKRILERAAGLEIQAETGPVPIRFSIGASTLPSSTDAPQFHLLKNEILDRVATDLIASADAALYAKKGTGEVAPVGTVTWGEVLVSVAA